ncbi:MAG: iron-containing alcohol dehydrogenase [bacterium]|nr:iron-containing alcohol dehydrogenase [bacterium]
MAGLGVRTWRLPAHAFGPGALSALEGYVASTGARRPLLVSDRAVARLGLAESVVAAAGLPQGSVGVFDDVDPELPLSCVRAALEATRAGGHDLIIGLGGGSTLDAAKVCAALSGRPGDVRDYIGVGKVPGPGLPSILIPTTAGSGSEATPNALIMDYERGEKVAMVSPHLIPTYAILDPGLTKTLPPAVTAQSGMDVLAHAIESYTSRRADMYTEMYSRHAALLAGRNLRDAVHRGGDLDARAGMLLGSFLAGAAIGQAGTSATHALAYPLGARYHVPHGLAIALLLPSVMAANRTAVEAKYAEIALLLEDGSPEGGLREGHQRLDGRAAAPAVRRLCDEIGIPMGLARHGVDPAAIPEMAAEAHAIRRLMDNNPRELSVEQVAAIFADAM